jgi:o-succinylbenzoate---CoA ligase
MVVGGWLDRAAAIQPECMAVLTPQGCWSYARLLGAARFAAGELSARGVDRGARVAIELPAGLEFAQALHACLLLGAIAVPVDLRLAGAERDRIAADAALRVTEPFGEGPDPRAPIDAVEHDLDATAVVVHTSGTSAAPRPIELTYANLLWSALGSAVALGLDPRERWLCTLPLAHVGGLSILLRSAIYATGAVVHERFEVDRVLRTLAREEVTLVSLVATTLTRLLDAGLERPPMLRCALTGGGPVPSALRDRAHDAQVPLSITYGLTESCSQVTTTPVAETTSAPASAGPPLFCTDVRIASDEEILVRSPTVARGSLGEDGWLHTGDLGSLDERARLHVTGRKADTIVSGGENVAPAEVEAVLEAHPLVLEAAVVPREDEQWGESVTAIVRLRGDGELPVEELRAGCLAALAAFKVPKHFLLTREPLPRTASGKLLRRELR